MPDINTDDELPADEAKVFLSYSRKDRENAQRIADVLRERHYGVFKDTDDTFNIDTNQAHRFTAV